MSMDMTSNLRKISIILLVIVVLWLVSGCKKTGVPAYDAAYSRAVENQDKLKAKRALEDQKIEALKKNADEQGGVSLMEDRDERPKGKSVEIFTTNNIQGVQNGGTPTRFTLDKKYYITKLGTYHWNDSHGTPPGTIGIKAADGKMYGPWKAELDQGVYWNAQPNTYIPAGSYTVVDSDPSTLAQNAESGGQGMAWASGIPAK